MADPQDGGGQNPSPEYQLKSLGVYASAAELRQLFLQLISTLSDDSLYNNKQVFAKLKGYSVPLRLVTEVKEIDEIPPDRWQTSLFLTDIVSLLTGIAKALNQTGKTERLSEFKPTIEDNYLLQQWFQEQRTGDLNKESFTALKEFIETLDLAFEDVLGEETSRIDEEAAKANEVATEQTVSQQANVGSRVNSGSSSTADTDTEGADTSDTTVNLEDPEVRTHFNTEVSWIYGFARQQLLIKHLEGLGTTFETLPPGLQNQFLELSALLRTQIAELIENLPPEKLSQLLNDAGNLRIRAEIFNLLLQQILSDPHSLFFAKLNEFYSRYFVHLAQTQPELAIEEVIDNFVLLEIRDTTTNEALQRIASSIQAWKQELIAKFKAEREAREQTLTQETEQPATTLSTPKEASLNSKLPAAAVATITADIDRSNFAASDKEILRTQAPRLLWGTAAELFRDEQGNLSNIDQALFNQVSAQALTYILSLESSELAKLQKSPSSLIRHIKNLRDRMLRDQNFVFLYDKHKANHEVPQLSRANRVEKETEWAYSQLTFELFSAHNITDETTPDEPGLQNVFDELKQYLHEKIFVYFDELPDSALEQLYIKPAQRNLTFRQLHTYINEDLRFVDTLGKFYNNLLQYYGNSQNVGFQQQLLRSLQKTVVTDGVHYRLNETIDVNTQQLFSQTVLKTVNSDSQILMNAVSATLDSMILAHGLQETHELINNINPKLLEATFGLQEGTLAAGNLDQFRSLLIQFSITRNSQFSALVGAEEARGIFGALNDTEGKLDYKNISKANEEIFNKRLSQISTVREVIQNNTSEVVAEAVNKKGTKEKVQVFFKYFQRSWDSIPQEGQIAIYFYYKIGGAEKYWEQYKNKTGDVSGSLPLPIEFIDFENKDRDGQLLKALVKELEQHGEKFNPLLTADFASSADSVLSYHRRVEAVKASLTLYYLQELDEIEQQEIAAAQGFASAAMLMEQLQVQAGQEIDQINLEIAQSLPSLTAVMGDEEYADQTATGAQQQSLLNRVLRRQGSSSRTTSVSKTDKAVKALQKAAGKKISQQIAKKTTSEVLKKAAGAVGGVVAAGLTYIITNPRAREYALGALTSLVGNILWAFSTVGGIIGGFLGGVAGFGWLGLPGGFLGSIAGANMGAQIAPWQWGDWLGFTPRQPPGPWFGSSPVDSTTVSMEGARAANASQAAAATQAANVTQATTAAQSANAATQAAATASPAATAATQAGSLTGGTAGATITVAPAVQGVWSYLTSLSIGVSAPLLALGVVILSTTYVIMIIAGAFVVPVPTRNSDWKGDRENTPEQESAQFVEITKTADITQIENNTPTDITYTITITPKGNYSVLITDISDVFSGYGGAAGASDIVSPLGTNNFPSEAFSSSQTATYTVSIGEGAFDSMITNTLIVSFEAIDINGFSVNPNATYRTSESIRVGEPKEGCWPASGTIKQLPGGGFSHGNSDAYDISNDLGTPIFAPFSGELCRMIDDNIDADVSKGERGYGIWNTLKTTVNGERIELRFAHLSESVIPSPEDDCRQVSALEVIGYMGTTGASTGPHLHYELWTSRLRGTGTLRLPELVPDSVNVEQFVNDCRE